MLGETNQTDATNVRVGIALALLPLNESIIAFVETLGGSEHVIQLRMVGEIVEVLSKEH